MNVVRWLSFALALPSLAAYGQLPSEPISIERGVPQFVHDSYLVDNHWAIKYKHQAVRVVFHAPVKHSASPFPVFASDNPSYVWVIRDRTDEGREVLRMYYQANYRSSDTGDKGPKYQTGVAYAESSDGLNWKRPHLNLFSQKTHSDPNNIVVRLSDDPKVQSNAPAILENLPAADQRGYRHVLMYRSTGRGDVAGIHLVGTQDGIHFDMENDAHVAHLHSDTTNTISYDPSAGNYVLFCRAKQMYRIYGKAMIDTGASRRVATMRSPELWADWMEHDAPRTLLVPDARDGETHHHFFYGMPTVHRYGIFWGCLQLFRMNDYIHTELVTSRDAVHWNRLPERAKLIDYSEDGGWDDTMIFVSPAWVEMEDEWWFYYTGWDGPHGTAERNGNVGLATCLRERVMSLRGPVNGGVVCTRTLVWPGGDLWLNAAPVSDAKTAAEVSVRVSDIKRRPLDGFDHSECRIDSSGDETRQRVTWEGDKSLDSLKGQTIRLEVFLQSAELFSLGAQSKEAGP